MGWSLSELFKLSFNSIRPKIMSPKVGTWDLEGGFKSDPEYNSKPVKRFFRVRTVSNHYLIFTNILHSQTKVCGTSLKLINCFQLCLISGRNSGTNTMDHESKGWKGDFLPLLKSLLQT